MSSFKKTNVKLYSRSEVTTNPDFFLWKKFRNPVIVKEFGAIDYIHFSPVQPHWFALTCSVRVQVYNAVTKQVHRKIHNFQKSAYGAAFRSDGELLCVGGEECNIKLFDIKHKSTLRIFKGHKGPVHRCFFTSDKTHIASFSDDATVTLWDIASESPVGSFAEHKDYIRAGAVSPVSSDIVLSGSYDKTVCMYDARTGARVLAVDHGAPVECVLFLPTGGVFLSAGGTEVRVWDALAGGRLLAKLQNHHKTVTCLHLAHNNTQILSGSLDRRVQISDVANYKLIQALDYPDAILSLGVSNNTETVVVGMVNGIISIRQKSKEVSKLETAKTSYKYIPANTLRKVDHFIPEDTQESVTIYDAHLRRFEYTRALDVVLKPFVVKRRPEVAVAVCQELMRRKGLTTALAGRDGKSLTVILRFLIKYIGDYRFTQPLIDVANTFLDVYEGELLQQELPVRKLMLRLLQLLQEEESLSDTLAQLQGAMHMLLAGSAAAETDRPVPEAILPSAGAQATTVFYVDK